MVNWLLKKTRDPVSEINKEEYEALAAKDSVSIVYHGDFASAEGNEVLNKIAMADDYNSISIFIQLIIGEKILAKMQELLK